MKYRRGMRFVMGSSRVSRARVAPFFVLPLGIALLSCDAPVRPGSPPSTPSSASTRGLARTDDDQVPPAISATPAGSAPPAASAATAPNETSVEREQPPDALPSRPEELAPIAKSANAFAFDLWGALRKKPGNLVFSPISIVSALTMAAAGAKGVTASEMKRVLHWDGAMQDPLANAGKLLASFQKLAGTSFHFGNRLFGDKSYRFNAPYVDDLRRSFGAPLEAVDFLSAPEAARVHINTWVDGQTEHRIRDLLPPASVDKTTKLAIVNAVAFKGNWSIQFSEGATRPEPFHASPSSARDVPTMQAKASFSFASIDQVRVVEMAYGAGDVAMLLVLPHAVDGLAVVEKNAQPATLARWIGALKPTYLDVTLPRFEINPAASVELRGALEALGMPSAFDEHRADFTGIAVPPDPSRRLYVSDVFHKAFIKLDEKGTEAVAATAVLVAEALSATIPPAPVRVKFDHPFLFILRDRRSGAILFMGRVTDPN